MIEALPALAGEVSAAPAGSRMVVVGSGLLAFLLSLVVWPVVGFAVTVAHEGGHALTASMMGGTVGSIKIFGRNSPQGNGVTSYRGVGPLGDFFTTLAGYLGPSAFGLLGAVLLTTGHSLAVLWLSLVFLLLALIQMGNILGGVVTVATGALIVLVLRYAPPSGQTFSAYTWIWFLLFGAFGRMIEIGGSNSGDAYALRKLSFLPATLWSGFFWLATLAALGYGGGILLGLVQLRIH